MRKSAMKRRYLMRLRAGFTLVESLIAVGILALFAAGVAALSATVLSTKNRAMEAAECRSVASSLLLTVADEMRYGQNIHEENGVLLLDSTDFGAEVSFEAKDGRIKAVRGEKDFDLMPESFYGTLSVQAFSAKRDGAAGDLITLSLTVAGGGNEPYTAEMSVQPLNGIRGI